MILAAIMLGTSLIFVALSIFYYDNVDPAEFENSADEEDEKSKKSSKRSTKNSQKSRKSDVKDDINDTTDLWNFFNFVINRLLNLFKNSNICKPQFYFILMSNW